MTATRHTISVIVPWDGSNAPLLEEQLDALSRQTMAPHEILVVQNRPSEARLPVMNGSVTILEAFGQAGPSHARNIGIANATSEFVGFCDADDVVGASWVASIHDALVDFDVVGGPLEYSVLNGPRVWRKDGALVPKSKFGYVFFPSSNLGVRRDVCLALGGFDEELLAAEDADFCIRAQHAGNSLQFVPEAVVHYRLRTGLREVCSQNLNWGRGDRALVRKLAIELVGPTWRELGRAVLAGLFHAATGGLSWGGRRRATALFAYLVGRTGVR